MGKIVIDIPQPLERHFAVDEESADALLAELEDSEAIPNASEANKTMLARETEKIIGIWSDRFTPEEAIEYAREIRRTGGRAI